MTKKKLLFLLLGLALIYLLWTGIQVNRFKTYSSPSHELNPLEIQGSYHIHSTHSDGTKMPAKIAELASRSTLDFIILTDHGAPNVASMASAGWKNGILLLAGSELSVNRGHLVALGFTPPAESFSQNAEQAANQVKALNGFSIIAHPYSKVSWSWGESIGYSGMEIINADTLVKRNVLRTIPLLPFLFVKPEFVLLKIIKRPVKSLQKWDNLNLVHPTWGFYSVDAHILYKSLLPFLQLHVLLKQPLAADFERASHQVLSALHQGRFYNAVEYAAHARGFRFWAQKGEKKVHMGEKCNLDAKVTLHIEAEFPFACEVHLIHNGKKIKTSADKRIVYPSLQPGFYRVEVYLKERSPMKADVPWILSNPIFFSERGL